MRLVVTRPEPGASRTAQALQALGHAAILSPALAIVPDATVVIPGLPFQAIVATSGNAAVALAANPAFASLAALPFFAVGDRTALAARRAGFASARSAAGDAGDLADLVRGTLDPGAGPILYVSGAHRAADLEAALRPDGFRVVMKIVYRSEPVTVLSEPARFALTTGAVDGILVYSRRSASAFALALRAARLAPLGARVTCYAISEQAAEPLRPLIAGRMEIAARPDQISLFAAIEADAAKPRSS